MADTYESILDRQWDDIPDVKTLPVGSYLLRGLNVVRKPPSGAGSESLLFAYEVKEAMDDVDEDELAELGSDYDYSNNVIYLRFWVGNARDAQGLNLHLKKHGIEVKGTDTAVDSAKENFKGTEVIAYLEHRSYENSMGETVLGNNPTQFAPLS